MRARDIAARVIVVGIAAAFVADWLAWNRDMKRAQEHLREASHGFAEALRNALGPEVYADALKRSQARCDCGDPECPFQKPTDIVEKWCDGDCGEGPFQGIPHLHYQRRKV